MSENINLNDLINAQQKVAQVRMCRFKEKLTQDPNLLDIATNQIYKKIIDDFTWEILCEFHRAHRFGYAELLCSTRDDEEKRQRSNHANEKPDNVIIGCPRPECTDRFAATMFVKHMSECMFGGGRKSKQAAIKRITCKKSLYGNLQSDEEDDKKKPKKSKKHSKAKNNSPAKNSNLLQQPSPSTSDDVPLNEVKNLLVEDHMAYLSTYCSPKSDSSTTSKSQKSKSKSKRTVTRKVLSSSLLNSVVSGNFINIQDLDLPAAESEIDTGISLSPADSNSSLSSSSSSYKRKSK